MNASPNPNGFDVHSLVVTLAYRRHRPIEAIFMCLFCWNINSIILKYAIECVSGVVFFSIGFVTHECYWHAHGQCVAFQFSSAWLGAVRFISVSYWLWWIQCLISCFSCFFFFLKFYFLWLQVITFSEHVFTSALHFFFIFFFLSLSLERLRIVAFYCTFSNSLFR